MRLFSRSLVILLLVCGLALSGCAEEPPRGVAILLQEGVQAAAVDALATFITNDSRVLLCSYASQMQLRKAPSPQDPTPTVDPWVEGARLEVRFNEDVSAKEVEDFLQAVEASPHFDEVVRVGPDGVWWHELQ